MGIESMGLFSSQPISGTLSGGSATTSEATTLSITEVRGMEHVVTPCAPSIFSSEAVWGATRLQVEAALQERSRSGGDSQDPSGLADMVVIIGCEETPEDN